MNPTPEPPTPPRFPSWWYLAAPWLVAVVLVIGAMAGIANQLLILLPFGLGRVAMGNWPVGLFVFTTACSALWARRRALAKGMRGADRFGFIMAVTVGLTIAQVCAAAAVFFVGCLVAVSRFH